MAPSEYQHIRFEAERNGVATITFNLPQMANAMDLLGVQETLDALRQCEKRPDVGAVVLTGAGEHAFSAGFNLKEIPSPTGSPNRSAPTSRRWRRGGTRCCIRSSTCRVRSSPPSTAWRRASAWG
jgi:enoyl-CoA hydratase/carnithine racemase